MPHQVATKNMTNRMIILYLALTGITGLVYGLCSLSGEHCIPPLKSVHMMPLLVILSNIVCTPSINRLSLFSAHSLYR